MSGLSLTGTTCTVYADGRRLADGTPGDPLLDPAVLSGLAVTWGRSTTVDQPEASTCSFELVDPVGGQAFLDQLVVGTPITVEATGSYTVATDLALADPDFETIDPTTRSWGAAGQRGTWATESTPPGTASLLVRRLLSSAAPTATYIAPDVLQPSGTNPAAWDLWPRPLPGESWRVRVSTRSRRDALHPLTVAASWEALPTPWLPSGGPVAGVPPYTWTAGREWATWAWSVTWPDTLPDGWVALHLTGQGYDMPWSSMPAGQPWTAVGDGSWTWENVDDLWIDSVQLEAPAGDQLELTVLVFAGRVTAALMKWPDGEEAPLVQVTCHDFVADLDNRDVGDEPWLEERLADRFQRILTLSGADVTAAIDATAGDRMVTWRDVDRQGATGLLQELATSADSVMWSAVHRTTGPYLRVEDPANRPSFYVLQQGADGLVTIVITPAGIEAAELDACSILRDPIDWHQDVQDVATISSATWLEQVVDDEGQPGTVEHTETVTDLDGVAAFGARRVSVGTQLSRQNDGLDVATRVLARLSHLEWRAAGLVVDDAWQPDGANPDDLAQVLLTLLDGTTRIGAPLRITGLPPWTPGGGQSVVYLEGGSYTFDGGAWVLDLLVSSATALGQSATWAELTPGWTWAMFAPGITWSELTGVSA